MKYKVASLFSGAGGLDLGFALSGRFEVVFANEILESAASTHAFNFGLKPVRCGSAGVPAEKGVIAVCDVAGVDFSPLRGEVDVVVGGPPCQDFSIVRGPESKRKGIEVRRGRLYAHFVRALIALQPKAFVFENVPGLLTANKGLAFKTILEDMRNLKVRWEEIKKAVDGNNGGDAQGYEILFADVVDMVKLGLPQMRKRLIIVGLRRDLAEQLAWPGLAKAKALAEKALKGAGSPFSKYPLTPIEVFEGRVLPELQDKYAEVMGEWDGVWSEVGTQRAYEWKREAWDKLAFDIVKDYLAVNGIKAGDARELEEAFEEHRSLLKEMGYYGVAVRGLSLPDGSNAVPEEDEATLERLRRIPPGENHEFVRGTRWEVKGLMSNIYRRIHPLAPAPTVIAYGGGGTWGYHYERNRGMLTNRERARLQSFPDNFLFKGTYSQVRAQIGEAVPPLVAKRIAREVASILSTLT